MLEHEGNDQGIEDALASNPVPHKEIGEPSPSTLVRVEHAKSVQVNVHFLPSFLRRKGVSNVGRIRDHGEELEQYGKAKTHSFPFSSSPIPDLYCLGVQGKAPIRGVNKDVRVQCVLQT